MTCDWVKSSRVQPSANTGKGPYALSSKTIGLGIQMRKSSNVYVRKQNHPRSAAGHSSNIFGWKEPSANWVRNKKGNTNCWSIRDTSRYSPMCRLASKAGQDGRLWHCDLVHSNGQPHIDSIPIEIGPSWRAPSHARLPCEASPVLFVKNRFVFACFVQSVQKGGNT
jgi:hypothetical protein